MRTFLTFILILACLTGEVSADVPAVAFYAVKTDKLKEIVPEDGNLKKISLSALENISTATGYFEGQCNFYLKTGDNQYRFKSESDGDNIIFLFRMFSQKDKKNIFSCSGEVKLEKGFSAKQDWQQEEYVVLFRRQNLSR